MRLPKFWPKSGHFNDWVVTLSSATGVLAAIAVGAIFGVSGVFGLLVAVGGYFVGAAAGFVLLYILNEFFGRDLRTKQSKQPDS